MTLLTRSTLKNLFKRGAVPSEVNFSDLIDSTVNKVDDGFAQSQEHGFMLAPQGKNRKLLSFFESIRDPNSSFSLSMNPDRSSKGVSIDDSDNNSVLFLREGGNIGIGTTTPSFKLQVDGMAGMSGRVGTFKHGKVKANGEWQTIIDELEGVNAFEVVAQAAGPEKRGKYALTYAIALCNYGTGKVEHVKSTYRRALGFLFDRISFRWVGNEDEYKLQVKTTQSYGLKGEGKNSTPCEIRFYASKLWDDSMFGPTPKSGRE